MVKAPQLHLQIDSELPSLDFGHQVLASTASGERI